MRQVPGRQRPEQAVGRRPIVTIAARYHRGQCLGTAINAVTGNTATPIQVQCKGVHDEVWVIGTLKGGDLLFINLAYTNFIWYHVGHHRTHCAEVLWIPGPVSLNSQVDFWSTAPIPFRGHVCTHGITGLGSCSLFYKS